MKRSQKKEFWEIIRDEDSKTIELIGLSNDDTLITQNTVEMIKKAGMNVRCLTEGKRTKEEIIKSFKDMGYNEEPGLYRRLLKRYKDITKESLDYY